MPKTTLKHVAGEFTRCSTARPDFRGSPEGLRVVVCVLYYESKRQIAGFFVFAQSGFNSWWRDRQRQRQERQRQRQGRQRPRRRSSDQASKHADGNGAAATGPGSSASAAQQHAAGGAADGCPLRRIGGLGKPLGGLLTLAAERELKCPTAIVQVRQVSAKFRVRARL